MKYGKLALCLSCASITTLVAQEKKTNVLLLIVDDLRTELGCYGAPQVKTPYIDRLANRGTLFPNAYCNVPVSGASRASLLTGVYPDFPERFTIADTYAQEDASWATPMPQAFRDNGYHAVSIGKVFHHTDDHEDVWSEKPWAISPNTKDWAEYNKWELWLNEESGKNLNPKNNRGPYCEMADVPDSLYEDNKIARKAMADLQRLKESDTPFFMAVGFRRPHLPFNAPKKYWDLYKREEIYIASNRYRSEGLPEQVLSSQEIFQYTKTNNSEEEAFHREARHAYYACVSFVDAQIGLVLNRLEELGLDDNTIVVLLGDHGWHLGEHTFWGKHNLMNHATRSPLIVRVPGNKAGRPEGVVEFVDIYPLLCDVCGIPSPATLQGKSLLPMIKDPSETVKPYAVVQWGKAVNIVDENYNYAQWTDGDNRVETEMLFDHKTDPDENRNCVKDESYRSLVDTFRKAVTAFKDYNKQYKDKVNK